MINEIQAYLKDNGPSKALDVAFSLDRSMTDVLVCLWGNADYFRKLPEDLMLAQPRYELIKGR